MKFIKKYWKWTTKQWKKYWYLLVMFWIVKVVVFVVLVEEMYSFFAGG